VPASLGVGRTAAARHGLYDLDLFALLGQFVATDKDEPAVADTGPFFWGGFWGGWVRGILRSVHG
jgi:hypothetical protein